MAILPILDQFCTHFGTPRPKIGGNQLLEVSENDLNELRWLVNGVVGREISILARLVWIIWQFVPILTNFVPILAPLDPKLEVTNYWRCLKMI